MRSIASTVGQGVEIDRTQRRPQRRPRQGRKSHGHLRLSGSYVERCKANGFGFPVALPMTYVIDGAGIIRAS